MQKKHSGLIVSIALFLIGLWLIILGWKIEGRRKNTNPL